MKLSRKGTKYLIELSYGELESLFSMSAPIREDEKELFIEIAAQSGITEEHLKKLWERQ